MRVGPRPGLLRLGQQADNHRRAQPALSTPIDVEGELRCQDPDDRGVAEQPVVLLVHVQPGGRCGRDQLLGVQARRQQLALVDVVAGAEVVDRGDQLARLSRHRVQSPPQLLHLTVGRRGAGTLELPTDRGGRTRGGLDPRLRLGQCRLELALRRLVRSHRHPSRPIRADPVRRDGTGAVRQRLPAPPAAPPSGSPSSQLPRVTLREWHRRGVAPAEADLAGWSDGVAGLSVTHGRRRLDAESP